jgi:hypothetical protein
LVYSVGIAVSKSGIFFKAGREKVSGGKVSGIFLPTESEKRCRDLFAERRAGDGSARLREHG